MEFLYLSLWNCYNGIIERGGNMALIICPECGKQISDKAEHCIGCGYPLKYVVERECQKVEEVHEDTRTELEKLVDEICARNENMYVAIKELRQVTGMDLHTADDLIRKKYKGMSHEERETAIKTKVRKTLGGLFSLDPLRHADIARCPKCRSVSISYQEQGNGKGYAVCLSCGERWNL